jgi:cytochrome c oxidase subunit 3
MAAHSDVKHDYHLVDPSPWPFVGSVSLFVLAVGAVIFMRGFVPAEAGTAAILGKGSPWIMLAGFAGVAYTMFAWWGDVIKESRRGDHTPVVDLHLRYGMILFIASEVMFFVAWFWMFFELAIFHQVRADWYVPIWDEATAKAWSGWPPPHVETFDPFHLPLVNTLILLLSGTTVTWAHHALQQNDRRGATIGLALTVALGVLFTAVQAYEYSEAGFMFGNQGEVTTANLYGSAFFMATGFHGAHVVIGTIFLFVCLMRLIAGQFTPTKHFGLEAAAWYWHFVDVVWLFLFAFVYVTPQLALGG